MAVVFGVTDLAITLGLIEETLCASPCQGCYRDGILNGTCFVNGRPSGCIGCAGACTSDDNCECRSGVGGRGARLAWGRDSDCRKRGRPTSTPAPAPTPTAVPPACDDGRVYTHIEEPCAEWTTNPTSRLWCNKTPDSAALTSSSTRTAALLKNEKSGWSSYALLRQALLRQAQEPEPEPQPVSFPTTVPVPPGHGAALSKCWSHDDPIVKIDLPMRLADSTVDWIEGELRARYYGAQRKEALPCVFELWQGQAMSVQTGLFDYPAQDPGVHGGKIILRTKGMPLNEPQRLALPFSVPVHLLDTTLSE